MPGLEQTLVDSLDFELSLGRIRTNVLTDFVLAPQYSAVYSYASDQLIDNTKRLLRSGEYSASIPIRVDVPKPKGFSRPGCILNPIDRIVYQILVDTIAPQAESELDRSRVFSNVLLLDDPDGRMFQSHDECWANLQGALLQRCSETSLTHVLKADVANYFERIYQHNLVNLLRSSGCDTRIVNLLEEVLLEFTGRNSHGIIQGVFPSDFLGNFYLASIDDGLRVADIPSIRYVDDLYLFFPSKRAAKKGLFKLINKLRAEGLNVNESKTEIVSSEILTEEETELDRLFELAKEEIRSSDLEIDVEWQYGFQTTWKRAGDVLESSEIELEAVETLYREGMESENRAEKVEKFCLPFLGRVGNMNAIENSLDRILTRPHLARVYSNYLINFVRDNPAVTARIESLLSNPRMIYDWALIWPMAVLVESNDATSQTIDTAIQIMEDMGREETLRSLAVSLIAKHGSVGQRRIVRYRYESEPSAFVREAILFASRYFPTNERNSCIRAWGSHSPINSLIAQAVRAGSTP